MEENFNNQGMGSANNYDQNSQGQGYNAQVNNGGYPAQGYNQGGYPAQGYNQGPSDKFCKYCGSKIAMDAVLCVHCGRQVEQIGGNSNQPQIIINNDNNNANVNNNMAMAGGFGGGSMKNKWVAVLLCLFFGYLGAHRFYEGKIGSGILYLFTLGLGGVGIIIDLIILLTKPNPYYV